MLKAIHAGAVERLYLMIVHSAEKRFAEIGAQKLETPAMANRSATFFLPKK